MDITEERPTHRLVTFVERETFDRVERMARENERSVSAEIRRALRRAYVDQREGVEARG